MKSKLIVLRDIWAGTTTAKHKGRKVSFDNLDEARDFAKKNGFKGIKVDYHSTGSLLKIVDKFKWKELFQKKEPKRGKQVRSHGDLR